MKQPFKLRREDLLTKAFIDVWSINQPLWGQVVTRAEWLNVVLQVVKPETEISQFSLYLGPRCAGNRDPVL